MHAGSRHPTHNRWKQMVGELTANRGVDSDAFPGYSVLLVTVPVPTIISFCINAFLIICSRHYPTSPVLASSHPAHPAHPQLRRASRLDFCRGPRPTCPAGAVPLPLFIHRLAPAIFVCNYPVIIPYMPYAGSVLMFSSLLTYLMLVMFLCYHYY